MTLGLGVLLSLFLLAPGLAFHAAMFPIHGSKRKGSKGMRFAVPPPGSVLALSVVGFGALGAHTVWASLSAVNDWICRPGGCIPVQFEPNIYTSMLHVGEHSPAVSSADVTVALVSMLVLSALTYAISSPLLGRSASIRNLRYGWLTELVDLAARKNHYTTAFVLTSVEHDGSLLGYDGLVENLSLNSDKEITAVTLTQVNRFVVRIGKSGVYRHDVDRNPIARLYIEKANFRNVALTVLETDPSPAT